MSAAISERRLSLPLMLEGVTIGSNPPALSPILADMARSLETAPTITGRAMSAHGAATALSALFLSATIDRSGARRVPIAGGRAMAAALAASAQARRRGRPAGMGPRLLGRVLNGWALSLVAGIPAAAFLAEIADGRLV